MVYVNITLPLVITLIVIQKTFTVCSGKTPQQVHDTYTMHQRLCNIRMLYRSCLNIMCPLDQISLCTPTEGQDYLLGNLSSEPSWHRLSSMKMHRLIRILTLNAHIWRFMFPTPRLWKASLVISSKSQSSMCIPDCFPRDEPFTVEYSGQVRLTLRILINNTLFTW